MCHIPIVLFSLLHRVNLLGPVLFLSEFSTRTSLNSHFRNTCYETASRAKREFLHPLGKKKNYGQYVQYAGKRMSEDVIDREL